MHKEEIKISLEEPVYLHLFTADPVDVFFRKDNSSHRSLVCKHDKCENGWKYNSNGHIIKLDTMTKGHVGKYTVLDRQKDEILCTYIVTEKSEENTVKDILITISVFSLVLFIIACCLCFRKKCNLYYGKPRNAPRQLVRKRSSR